VFAVQLERAVTKSPRYRRPALRDHRGEGHRAEEALPIYLVYAIAWQDHGVLKTVPDVHRIDRRHVAAASGQ
jgi:murein L,D-transpeptidase YcbB/YkuD